jgi:hypothetical protein
MDYLATGINIRSEVRYEEPYLEKFILSNSPFCQEQDIVEQRAEYHLL